MLLQTLEDFWIPQKAAFGGINVTAFLVQNPLPEAENVIRHVLKEPGKKFDVRIFISFFNSKNR